jgi:hypothetical protein
MKSLSAEFNWVGDVFCHILTTLTLIQSVFVGDFYQLPPVPDFQGAGNSSARAKVTFAFQANCWKKCIPNIITLTE